MMMKSQNCPMLWVSKPLLSRVFATATYYEPTNNNYQLFTIRRGTWVTWDEDGFRLIQMLAGAGCK
jgi:hypothetical protein